MEIQNAAKILQVEYVVIDGKEIEKLFEARVKKISIFDVSYNIVKQKLTNVKGQEFEYILSGLAGNLKDGNVVTSEGEIFVLKSEFDYVYDVEFGEESVEQEEKQNNE